ncbi:11737_t:CDS:2, partial [Racocetra persica]
MKHEDYLVTLVKDIVKTVVKKVVQNLNMFQRKQRKRGSHLCYVCWRKGHLAYLCPSIKDQSYDRSLNYNVMDVCHVEVGRKKHEGLKRSGKIKMEQKVDGKNRDNDEVVKRVKVNRKFAKASIRLSSSLNLMSMRYVRSKGLTWKCLNEDDEVIEYVPGIEIDVDGVKVVQEFYVKHELASDVILGMPWVMKTRCSFEWKDRKCHYVRRIKGKLTETDSAGEEKKKCSDRKDNNVDNKAEFDYNGGEAADGRTNESGKDYHESKIENEKDEQNVFVQCQSLGKMSCSNETRDHKCDDKNKQCIGLGGASMSHPSTIRTLNSMLKAKRNVNNFVRLNGVSCRRVKTSRKVVNNVYASLVE